MPKVEAEAVKSPEPGKLEANETGSTTQQSKEEPQAGSKEYNWRQMEKRLQEQEQQNRLLQEALVKMTQPQQQPTEESVPELSPDDLPEWKHVTQGYKALEKKAEKIAEQKIKQFFAEKEKEELPAKARRKFADFDEVVTAEKVKNLEQTNPELAAAIAKADDVWTATYSVLKLHQDAKNKMSLDDKAKEEAEKIVENASKPGSVNAIGKGGALSNANAFAKKSKDQLYKDMMRFSTRG